MNTLLKDCIDLLKHPLRKRRLIKQLNDIADTILSRDTHYIFKDTRRSAGKDTDHRHYALAMIREALRDIVRDLYVRHDLAEVYYRVMAMRVDIWCAGLVAHNTDTTKYGSAVAIRHRNATSPRRILILTGDTAYNRLSLRPAVVYDATDVHYGLILKYTTDPCKHMLFSDANRIAHLFPIDKVASGGKSGDYYESCRHQ